MSSFREYILPSRPIPVPQRLGRPPGSGHFLPEDFSLPLGNSSETDEEIDLRIARTFRVFDKQIQNVISGVMRALLVSGAGGVGKSYGAMSLLHAAQSAGACTVKEQRTTISAIELYKLFYNNRLKNNIIVLDDCDSIWADLEAIGVLKHALDTNSTRVVQWTKANTYYLDVEGIPTEFEYDGSCIFITNLDLQNMIDKNTKFAKHYHALMSRVCYLDMGIHSKREVLIRICQVLRDTPFLEEHNFPMSYGDQMVEWLTKHLIKIRALSVRTCIELGRLIHNDPDWQETAEVILFRRS